jgi:hypothetical protein
MKNIYSFDNYLRVNENKKYSLNENFNFLRKFNPVSIISNAVEWIRDFLIWEKESEDPRFKKVKRVWNCFTNPDYEKDWNDLSDMNDNLKEKIRELEKENSKPYSELKYQISEEIMKLHSQYKLKYQKFIEMLYVDYYQQHGVELYDDVKDVIEFLKTSRWYRIDSESQQQLKKFLHIVGESNIKSSLDNTI